MAIELPNGKISRTLPEQVGFNSKKIEEIIKAINDFELVDKVIDLDSASGVLTDIQFGIAELSPSFILYSGKVFVKAYEDGTYIDFIEVGALVSGSTTLKLSVERFRITIATKAYQYAVVQLFETYSKTQIDSLISGLSSVYAALSGANFTGPITSPSIIETMSGYSFTKRIADYDWTPIYVGIVKNGNKLTFVMFGSINIATLTDSYTNLAFLDIPSDLGAQLFPYEVQGYGNVLDNSKITYMDSTILGTFQDGLVIIQKQSDSRLAIQIRGLSSLTLNRDYYFRIEKTFLLSDNLAS